MDEHWIKRTIFALSVLFIATNIKMFSLAITIVTAHSLQKLWRFSLRSVALIVTVLLFGMRPPSEAEWMDGQTNWQTSMSIYLPYLMSQLSIGCWDLLLTTFRRSPPFTYILKTESCKMWVPTGELNTDLIAHGLKSGSIRLRSAIVAFQISTYAIYSFLVGLVRSFCSVRWTEARAG